MNSLSFEEQLFHSIFCQQIQGIKLENAKQLLVDLHLVYLSQQAIIAYLTTQDTLIDLTTQEAFNDLN
jgi:restriction endonuclease S subunit